MAQCSFIKYCTLAPNMYASMTSMAPTKSRDPHSVKITNLNQSAPHPKPELKEPPKASARPPPVTKQTSSQQVYTKKIPHRSSKPIINWFQRKLAGTVKPRRVPDTASAQQPPNNKNRHSGASHSRSNSRSVSSPLPQITPSSSQRQGAIGNGSRNGHRLVTSAASHRKTLSLNGEGDLDSGLIHSDDEDLDASTHRSSLALDSLWSPASALEADEDASLRPLPPSAPPSPSLSHSSSSYLSNPRTFRSIAASTKPTTVLSIDLGPAGIGHIAQAPVTPVTPVNPRFSPHGRTSSTGTSVIGSGASITFSALPRQSSPRPQSSMNFSSSTPGLLGSQPSHAPGLQAPLYTAYHPRNNPRPSSPPMDNASVLTLASSAYAMPGTRLTMGSMGSVTLSGLLGGGDSISHLGDSFTGDGEGEMMSQFVLGDDDRQDVDVERDVDASVRALRPRSSRRGSWDSEVSGWSARILGTGGGAMSLGSKSLWTSNSAKTGGPPGVDDEVQDDATGGLETSLEDKSSSDTHDQTDGPELGEPAVGDEQQSQHSTHSTKETVVEDPLESVDNAPATVGRAAGPTVISKLLVAET